MSECLVGDYSHLAFFSLAIDFTKTVISYISLGSRSLTLCSFLSQIHHVVYQTITQYCTYCLEILTGRFIAKQHKSLCEKAFTGCSSNSIFCTERGGMVQGWDIMMLQTFLVLMRYVTLCVSLVITGRFDSGI